MGIREDLGWSVSNYKRDPYRQYIIELNRHDHVVALILAVVAVVLLLFGVVKLTGRSRTECAIELSNGSKVEAKGCFWWNKSNTISCDNHKNYSVFAVKSWECK